MFMKPQHVLDAMNDAQLLRHCMNCERAAEVAVTEGGLTKEEWLYLEKLQCEVQKRTSVQPVLGQLEDVLLNYKQDAVDVEGEYSKPEYLFQQSLSLYKQ